MATQELKKHVAAIHISNKLSLLQRKAANVLLLNAYENLLVKETHKIRVKDLASLIGFESHNLEVLRDALRGLMSTLLEWNLLNEQGYEEGWEASTMLASVRLQRGYCVYAYSPLLREKLYNPEIYARINLSIQRRLSSGYALALYENCLRYRKTHSTGWISLDIFRKLMGVSEDKYSNFKRFSSRVIRDPVKQINGSSDIYLEAEYKREKRKVTAIRFRVKENPQLSLFASKLVHDTQLQPEVLTFEDDTEESLHIRKQLIEFGLSVNQAQKILDHYEGEYIRQNLAVVERDYQAGKVENLPAYTLASLKEDYRPRESSYESAQKEKMLTRTQVTEQQAQARADLETLKKDFDKHRLQKALNSLSDSERAALESRFRKHYEHNPVFLKWAKKGMDYPVIQSLFRAFASKELLGDFTESEFKAFTESHDPGVLPGSVSATEAGDLNPVLRVRTGSTAAAKK